MALNRNCLRNLLITLENETNVEFNQQCKTPGSQLKDVFDHVQFHPVMPKTFKVVEIIQDQCFSMCCCSDANAL